VGSSILLAKQLATLDVVSGGRPTVGAALGQRTNMRRPASRSGGAACEWTSVCCLKLVWTEEVVEFKRAFYVIPA
jgi:alkanesulfonate monooxygenase SsuD/methylene tetrahydromethanopterin reductase-like flavin-dependent oxidoreductase (luciferase family)